MPRASFNMYLKPPASVSPTTKGSCDQQFTRLEMIAERTREDRSGTKEAMGLGEVENYPDSCSFTWRWIDHLAARGNFWGFPRLQRRVLFFAVAPRFCDVVSLDDPSFSERIFWAVTYHGCAASRQGSVHRTRLRPIPARTTVGLRPDCRVGRYRSFSSVLTSLLPEVRPCR
jgi:hypothetical protein